MFLGETLGKGIYSVLWLNLEGMGSGRRPADNIYWFPPRILVTVLMLRQPTGKSHLRKC